ncbi:glutathione transferase [Castellaniella defragrans]|uniref:Probable glutathione S-transferase n=1 Tax=Castellaniella defragrans (strain DSM 12143 / CCUG 39792 / 65Phen) TaxID=1437824 RepID=W8X2R2_CASD6|nr:glutathione transferase [Castellaniella defragrans]CDM23346.1 Probable glutathione S-transferase [Castellaniella defragrans 65Phen]
MSQPVTLYTDANFISPYAMSAFVALEEKGVSFELSPVDLDAGAQRESGYVSLSVTGKVPALAHGSFALAESSAIAEYLDEVFPGPALYPSDAQGRARARQIQAWLRSDLMPIREERSAENLFRRPPPPAPLSDAARQAADRLFAVADRLLPQGASDLFGAWSIADFDLALMISRLTLCGDAVPQRLADYADRQWHRPSAQRWVVLPRPGL